MTWETGSTDDERLRAGYAVLSLGLFVLFAAWIMTVIRSTETVGTVAARNEKITPPNPNSVAPFLTGGMMLIGVLLLLLLVISIIALVRLSRYRRNQLFSKPRRPTPTSDV